MKDHQEDTPHARRCGDESELGPATDAGRVLTRRGRLLADAVTQKLTEPL